MSAKRLISQAGSLVAAAALLAACSSAGHSDTPNSSAPSAASSTSHTTVATATPASGTPSGSQVVAEPPKRTSSNGTANASSPPSPAATSTSARIDSSAKAPASPSPKHASAKEDLGPKVTIYGAYSGGDANVRSGPGTDFAVVGGLSYRAAAQARMVKGAGWYKLTDHHYVSASVVSTHKPAEETTSSLSEAAADSHSDASGSHAAPKEDLGPKVTIYGAYSGGDANVRSGPGTDFAVVGGLSYREAAQARMVKGAGWYKLSGHHYISASVVSTHKPAKTQTGSHDHTSAGSSAGGSPSSPWERALWSAVNNVDPGRFAHWVIVDGSDGHWGTTSGAVGSVKITISRNVPVNRLDSVVKHEWMHALQIRYFGSTAEGLKIMGSSTTESMADCGALLQGASWVHYGCRASLRDDAQALLAGQAPPDYTRSEHNVTAAQCSRKAAKDITVYAAASTASKVVGHIAAGKPVPDITGKNTFYDHGRNVSWARLSADQWILFDSVTHC